MCRLRIIQSVSGTLFLCSKLWCACIQVFCTLVSSSNLLYIVFRILSALCTFRLKVLIINYLTSVDKSTFCLHFVCTACTFVCTSCTFCLHYLHFCLHCLHFFVYTICTFVCTVCTAVSIVASCLYRLELSVQAVRCYGCAR